MEVKTTTGIPTLETIRQAHEKIKPYIKQTPVLTCQSLNDITGGQLFFKCENFQKIGAFKFRGATNAVLSLPEEVAVKGVTTHSSGNHGQAVALAAKMRGIKAYIVMPEDAPAVKKAAVKGYGAEIIFCKRTEREATVEQVQQKTGAALIHPYDNYKVIEGQATAAKELIEEVKDLDIIMAPVGGGGLISGTALSTHYLLPSAKVIAAEPKGADDAYQSFKSGKRHPAVNPKTVADGLLTSLGERNFDIIIKYVNNIVTVEEENIIKGMRMIWERMKVVIEASSAVPFGAILENKVDVKGKKVGIILTGGNVDLDNLPWITPKS